MKDTIKELDKVKNLHFANPAREELAKKFEFSKEFRVIRKILIGK